MIFPAVVNKRAADAGSNILVSAAKNIYAISATQWFAPKSMNDATERIVTYGAIGYYFTPIYIRIPQNIPRIIFSNHKLEILIRVIAAAPAARDDPRGVAKSKSEHNAQPIRLPIHIVARDKGLIWRCASRPALPVNKLNWKNKIVNRPIENMKAPNAPPTVK
jgi:hypothetical protein